MSMRTTGRRALWGVVAAVAGVAEVWVAHRLSRHYLTVQRWPFEATLALWGALWLPTALALSRLSRRTSVVLILALAVALRVASLAPAPSISNDLARYVWDAHVQLSGVDPYRYPPDAAQLRPLRVPQLFPPASVCAARHHRPGCTVLNRPQDRTIYPAVAEGYFVAVHLLSPGDYGTHPWQIAGGAVDLGVIVLLLWELKATGRDPRRVAWYALCPVPVLEFAGNAHVDCVALLLLVAAALALRRRHPALAGVLIGAAVMVKLYPALALVAFWRRGRWRMALPALVVMVLTELPHVLAVGTKVLGYLPGYLHEEQYSTGGRFLLVDLAHLSGHAAVAVVVVCMLVAMGLVLRADLEPATGTALLLAVLFALATPVQPWYAVTLGGMGVLAEAPWLLLPALAAEPYYAAVVLGNRHATHDGRLLYGAAVAGMLVCWAVRTWSTPLSGRHRPLFRFAAGPPPDGPKQYDREDTGRTGACDARSEEAPAGPAPGVPGGPDAEPSPVLGPRS
jgi:hypothetical protein